MNIVHTSNDEHKRRVQHDAEAYYGVNIEVTTDDIAALLAFCDVYFPRTDWLAFDTFVKWVARHVLKNIKEQVPFRKPRVAPMLRGCLARP